MNAFFMVDQLLSILHGSLAADHPGLDVLLKQSVFVYGSMIYWNQGCGECQEALTSVFIQKPFG